jgi:hypothetical protein
MRNVLQIEVEGAGFPLFRIIMDDGWWSNEWYEPSPKYFGNKGSGTWRLNAESRVIAFFEEKDNDEGPDNVAYIEWVQSFPMEPKHSGYGVLFESKYRKGMTHFSWKVVE